MPNFLLEDNITGDVCGLDEVGRGPLAGPVTAACVFVPEHIREYNFIKDIQDSKKLSPKKRDALAVQIKENCVFAISEASIEEIDSINILQASLLAMRRAYDAMGGSMNHALVDGNKDPSLSCATSLIVKGDDKSVSIAAASIIAKVERDKFMQKIHEEFPEYGWNTNSGYGSKKHIEALEFYGATKYHRQSFAPVAKSTKRRTLES